ncbi:hypothetical protein M8J76_012357 [Diaphorina citri]|nr:hypothetical protein M8J76_012357 [Diaphorina citri]KAI5735971.1 hypothetical protein M8J77_024926 [Diaphorina citri]
MTHKSKKKNKNSTPPDAGKHSKPSSKENKIKARYIEQWTISTNLVENMKLVEVTSGNKYVDERCTTM